MTNNNLTLNSAIDLARAYPRNYEKCVANIKDMIKRDVDLASSCYYSLPQGDSTISGPSIRLAEICAMFWGHLEMKTSFVSNDGRRVVSSGTCWDLENNIRAEIEVSTSIVGKNKDGKEYIFSNNQQEKIAAAAASKALRNAIFKVIPLYLIDSLYKIALEVVKNPSKIEFDKLRDRVFNYLPKIELNSETVLQFFDKNSISDITPEELTVIQGICTSVKEGRLDPLEAFSKSGTKALKIAEMI